MKKIAFVPCVILLVVLMVSCASMANDQRGFYPTYIFSHSEIVIFAYHDNTDLTVTQPDNALVWDGRLDAGEHHVLQVAKGVYNVVGNQPYATLVGDPVGGTVMGYYAIDEQGRGTSQFFHTYQSSSAESFFGLVELIESAFVIFAYEDATSVTLRNSETNRVIWQGELNEGEAYFEYGLDGLFLTVEASAPVSALSYTDQGYYVPSKDGRFVGTRFYTWAGNAGDWVHDLNLIAYADGTAITVMDSQSQESLWQRTLNSGEMYAVTDVNDCQLTVSSDKDIAVSVSPSVSYDSEYHHMIFAQDETGSGIGTNFFYPAISDARLEIFAYEDGTAVAVRDAADTIVYQGLLNQGESAAFDSEQTLYTITADRPVSALMNWGDEAGADFAPPYYTAPTAAIVAPQPTAPAWQPIALIAAPLLLATIAGGYYFWRSRQQTSRRPSRAGSGGSLSVPPSSSLGGDGYKLPADKKKPPRRGSSVTHGRDK